MTDDQVKGLAIAIGKGLSNVGWGIACAGFWIGFGTWLAS